MADVTVQIVTTIKESWGTVTLDLTHEHQGAGRLLADEVDAAIIAAVEQVRTFTGRLSSGDQHGDA